MGIPDSMRNSPDVLTRRELMKYGFYGGLAACFVPGLCGFSCKGQDRAENPNVILITVDTLRADHLGCYGYFRNTSPNIDLFAKEALLFENCISHAPVTSSSFASILSGFLPHETKVFENLPIPAEVPTLQKSLQKKGYKTIAVVSNYALQRKKGWAKGFDVYDDEMTNTETVRNHPERIAEHTTSRAIKLLKQHQKEKLFMWIHFQDPHGPYTPPKRFARFFQTHNQRPRSIKVNNSLSGYGGIPSYQRLGNVTDYHYYVLQYDREVRYQDEQLKILLDSLKKLGIYDNGLIIFSADHGEGMGKHNYYFAHGENLYNCLLRVPLIIKYGNTLRGRRKDFVQHIDIVPTIRNIVGIKSDSRLRGTDLRLGNSNEKEIYSEMKFPKQDGVKFSIMVDGIKLIFTEFNNIFELYDLKTDPHEDHNLAGNPDYKEHVRHLYARLKHIRNEDFLGLKIENKPHQMTEEEINKMKSLGYLR